ncbi:ABC transporter permease [Rugosimonospora acidiphila]|uniref:Transport permease protein n=1 Tax=Rugosimonospora acidiphila TaxID=556531 RepID=A0ABP9RUW0_9ACTN
MWREFGYWMTQYRRTWRGTIVISVANPLLFLLGVGVGIGHLVDRQASVPLAGVSYLAFFAPGMLAAASMQTAFLEASNRVAMAAGPDGAYRGATTTPLSPAQIMGGHLLFIAFRVATSSAAFTLVMLAFRVTGGARALGTLGGALLTGMAFAAPAAAWAVGLRQSRHIHAVFRFVIMPMYLFSGTFFTITQLPHWLRPIVYVLPLYHGAQLCRTLSLGTATVAGTAVHVGVLAALVLAGIVAARVTYRRRLHP